MSLTLNVPSASQTLGQTYTPISGNFSTINTAFSVDHVEYAIAGQGKHNKVTMPAQSVSPTTVASELALFSKLVSGVPQMMWRQQSNGSEIDFTSAGKANPGWTRLPSGILLKWHSAVSFPGGTTLMTVNTDADVPGSPAFTNLFTVLITVVGTSVPATHAFGVTNITSPSFTAGKLGGTNNVPNTVALAYLAIGI